MPLNNSKTALTTKNLGRNAQPRCSVTVLDCGLILPRSHGNTNPAVALGLQLKTEAAAQDAGLFFGVSDSGTPKSHYRACSLNDSRPDCI